MDIVVQFHLMKKHVISKKINNQIKKRGPHMKVIIILTLAMYCFSAFSFSEKELSCSNKGTEILYINGITYEPEDVIVITRRQIKNVIPENFLDKKIPSPKVIYNYSYNTTNGFLKDMLESSAQKLSQNFKISLNDAFIISYYFLLFYL